MIYVWHALGILCAINVVTGFLAGDQITATGRKAMPLSLVVVAAYLVSLFFIF
jgi:hypothetical protein